MQKVFTILDSAMGTYTHPFFTVATGAAIRQFADIASKADHPVGQHPEDYTLFEIGTFDENTGIIEVYPAKISRGCAIDLKLAMDLKSN